MTATLSKETASALGLMAAGDEAYLEVTAVNADGSVEVMTEMEGEEDEAPTDAVPESAMAAIKRTGGASPASVPVSAA